MCGLGFYGAWGGFGWPHGLGLLAVAGHFVKRRYAENSLMTFIPYGPSLVLGAFYILYLF